MDGIEFVNFPCPQCQSRQRAAKHLVGRTFTCMQCRQPFKVPAESTLDAIPVAERNSSADFELPVETSAAPLPEVPLSLPPVVAETEPMAPLSEEFADAEPMDVSLVDALPLEAVATDAAAHADANLVGEPVLSLGDDAPTPLDVEALPLEAALPLADALPVGEPPLPLEGELQLASEAPASAEPVAAADPVLGLEGDLAPAPIPEEEALLFPEDDLLALSPEEPIPAPNPAHPAPAHPPKAQPV